MNDSTEDLTFNENLEILQEQINFLSDKIKNGRIKDVKKEELKIKWIRALGYLCKTYAKIKEVQKLDELEEEIKNLKENLEK